MLNACLRSGAVTPAPSIHVRRESETSTTVGISNRLHAPLWAQPPTAPPWARPPQC